MTEKQKEIIIEFISATPLWVKTLKDFEFISGHKCCPMCGSKASSVEELSEAIKQLVKENDL